MNILNLATFDENAAGVASRNINEMFLQLHHNSVLLVKQSGSKRRNVIALQKTPTPTILSNYKKRISDKINEFKEWMNPLQKDDKYSFHNLNEKGKHYSGSRILKSVPFKPDVILIFWVSGFVNAATIKELSTISGCKIFLLMTDNAPITGGCHYPWNCEGFHTDCTGCPAILNESRKKIASKNLSFKKVNLPVNIELIAGSESDYRRANKASLFKGKKIHKLVAPIDQNRFVPGNKEAAKQYFGINPAQKIIFFGATSLNDPRKGVQYFLDALYILQQQSKSTATEVDFLILLAGKEGFEPFRNIGIPIKEVGYLNEENLIKAYQAADFAVSPSLEDSGPMMVNQCIMCGTPMLAFNTGVAMDLVKTGETGYIAKLFDAVDFAEGMKYLLLLNDEESKKMSFNCRSFALSNITPEIYAEKMISLF